MKLDQKLCVNMKKEINRGKESKTLNEVKPMGNVNKNQQSFLVVSPKQEEVLSLHKLKGHAYK